MKEEEKEQSVISSEDFLILEQMANKYEMSLNDFFRYAIKTSKSSPVHVHVRFTPLEIETIDKKREKKNLTRQKYILFACQKVLRSEKLYSLTTDDLRYLKKHSELRSAIVVLSFSNKKMYNEIHSFCSKISLPISSFLRHCAVTYGN